MDKQHTVSVVMITYNGAQYIRQQLDSLLNQTMPFAELIVQDDRSTDDTCDIVRSYASRDPRIKLFVNERNLGWNMNFITAMKHATCEYIALCDQDDIWYPLKIEKELREIGSHTLCFCYRDKDEDYSQRGKVVARPQADFESLLFTSHIPGHDMLIPRSLLDKIDTWNPRIPYDWWLGIQAHLHGEVTFVPESLNWHRPHADSASAQMMKAEWAKARTVSWQPYLFGWKAYAEFQKMEDWQWLYHYIADHTSKDSHPLVHRMATLLHTPGILPLLQLCVLTMVYRQKVHARFSGGKGLKWFANAVRGFFYVLMWTYNNNSAFMQKPLRHRH